MTWYLVSNTTFAGPVSSVGAGQTLQNGWIDLAGSQFNINSGNYLSSLVNQSAPWNTACLVRPSSENEVDSKIVATFTAFATGRDVWIQARSNRSTSANTSYIATADVGNGIQIDKVVAGSVTSLYNNFAPVSGFNAGTRYNIEMDTVQTNGTTTTITVTLSTTGGTVLSTATITDTTTALQNASGSNGLFVYSNGSVSQNDVSVIATYTDIAPTLTPGTASTTSSGNAIATVTCGAASGGTSPYTYQWYRSTTSGFTPGGGNLVSGATSLTLNDTGLTNGTTYYYKNVVTDSASNTATSNQTSATPSASLVSGTASTTSTGSTIATVVVGNASGGTSPYTYQWYRSTTTGFTPGAGNILAGATSETLNDTGLTNGTTYYYKNVVTDSASNTAISNQTSATPVAANILAVTSNSIIFSPGNWKGDTGRGGSVYRQTWNPGAYFRAQWTAAASGATASVLMPSTSTGCTVSYFINGELIATGVAATSNISLSGIVAGAVNNLLMIMDASPETSRWNNGTNTWRVTGVQLDTGSTGGVAPVMNKWGLLAGDSIQEGISANAGTASFIYDYAYFVGGMLLANGYDYCINACGYSGWLEPGDSGGDVPAYYDTPGGVYSDSASRWNKIDNGVSLLDSNNNISSYGNTATTPSFIYLNLGTNEEIQSASLSDLQASVTQYLTAARAAAPSAKIIVGIPFSLYNTATFTNGPAYIAAIKAGIAAHSTDVNITTGDCGASISQLLANSSYASGALHPFLLGHATLAPLVTQQILSALVVTAPTPA